MLWNEFENAYLSVNQNNPRVTPPLNCSASVRQAIQAVYTSRKGDSLFAGSDQHRRCAVWVRDNQATVARLARWIGRREQRKRWSEFRVFYRDCRAIRDRSRCRVRLYQLATKELRARFSHLLSDRQE